MRHRGLLSGQWILVQRPSAMQKKMYFVDRPYYMNRQDNPNSSVHNRAKYTV